MDAIRKQLDQLMGANRNGDVREVSRKYYDRDVCRLFLAGLCPHDLFQLTKMDMGPCPKLHSLQLRKEYEEAKAKGMDNYDRELEETIERLISECERKIQRALKRLEDDDAKAAIAISVTEVTQSKEVLEFSKQIKEKMKEIDAFDLEGNTEGKIRATEEVDKLKEQRAEEQAKLLLEAFNKDRVSLMTSLQTANQSTAPAAAPDARTQEMIAEKLKKAEELGENGMIDEAQKLLDEAEALKKLGARPQPVPDSAKMSTHVQITDQKLRLCDICGAFLSMYDSDRRLADHFGGKLHMGYMLIREKLPELQEEKNKRRKMDRAEYDRRSRERSLERDRASSKDRHRGDRESSRDRDYGHRRSHDRYHDRESRPGKDRESGRSRSYDSRGHRRSRSPRDSSRDYDQYGRDDRRHRR
ncbi:U1 snRNP-associated protein usp106-like isoform X2 [Oryza brachyantha]|uniref:U1 snRNP-associated protein usp106-like isoform X2 n=1 Tax=Oryza brachyantha TaxID=4533 RepID=UPI0003EA7E97|nr:U1 snRNP-associated protein usp106-like isoform X2 [Oryza brachyantha]